LRSPSCSLRRATVWSAQSSSNLTTPRRGYGSLLYLREHSFGYGGRSEPPPLDRARDAAQRAIKLEPDSSMAHFVLASVYFFRDELERFRVEANTALTLNPNNALVLAELGNYFGYLGELDRSLALTEKAVALNPHHPSWYYSTIFNYHYHKGEYEEALAAAQNWNEPYLYWNQVHLAQAYAMLGREEEAQAAITKLLELKPDFALRAREEFEIWNNPEEIIEHELHGLRKAGLDIPDESAMAD
jgi:adenylate cyclase